MSSTWTLPGDGSPKAAWLWWDVLGSHGSHCWLHWSHLTYQKKHLPRFEEGSHGFDNSTWIAFSLSCHKMLTEMQELHWLDQSLCFCVLNRQHWHRQGLAEWNLKCNQDADVHCNLTWYTRLWHSLTLWHVTSCDVTCQGSFHVFNEFQTYSKNT